MSDRSWQAETLVLEEFDSTTRGKWRVVAEVDSDGVYIREQVLDTRGGVQTWDHEYDGATAVNLSYYALARLIEHFGDLPQRYPRRT